MGGELQSTTTTTMTKKKKKKGRPSLLDLQKRSLKQQQQRNHQNQIQNHDHNQQQNPNFYSLNPNRRSTRQNPSVAYECRDDDADGDDDDDDDDDDDERRQKKHRLLHGLNNNDNSSLDGSDALKRRRITHLRTRSDQTEEKVSKATDTLHGLLPVESGPTTPLPDKKLLVFVLDRLQKKDTYGVFSEPVDPEELPDYHDIISHPMDFATVRKKLDGGAYGNLEDFEKDVLLICSNAMQYNSPDTIYFRQARSIQELAKKDFENLRQDSDDSEPQPQLKVVRRGRPPKNLKKSLDTSPSDRIASEFSSDATLANGADNGTNPHNLRKGPMPSFKFRPAEVLTRASHGSHAGDNHTNFVSEWENEFPASVVKAVMKYGKKHFPVDENKRDTYMDSLVSDHEPSVFTTFEGELKQLMVVGLNAEHGYARSLARFAADLGPIAWKNASRKIHSVLPNGVNFGPGWVGENKAIEQQHLYGEKQKSSNNYISSDQSSRLMSPATSCSNSIIGNRYSSQGVEDTEIIREVNPRSESTFLNSSLGGIKPAPGPAFQIPLRPVIHTDTDGFSGSDGFGFNRQPLTGIVRHETPLGKSTFDNSAMPCQMHGMAPGSNHGISSMPASDYSPNVTKLADSSSRLPSENSSVLGSGSSSCRVFGSKHQGNPSWQGFSAFHKQDFQPFAPPDLNTRFLAPGSPISTMQMSSPQQPDLALQL